MQNVYYIDNHFVKEKSNQYILSIRYSTDGLSFCVHDADSRLLVFFYQPYSLDTKDAMIARVKKIIVDEELLNLKYKKVFILSCGKEKTLIPAYLFDKEQLADIYRLSLQPQKNDTLLYRKLKLIESYMAEALPRNFVTFLTKRYPSLCIVNSAYPFIINSMENTLHNTNNLFVDIHDQHFDLLLTRGKDILLFNSFDYRSIPDLIYYTLNCIKQCNILQENLHTTISGNLANESKLIHTFRQYLSNINILNYPPLSQLVKSNELNNSSFIYLLSMHQCE